jgi:hypothetical protein
MRAGLPAVGTTPLAEAERARMGANDVKLYDEVIRLLSECGGKK